MTADDFIAAILSNPTDDGLRRIFADWIEEHDDLRRASRLREPGWWWMVSGVAPLRTLVWMRDFAVDSRVNPAFALDGLASLPLCWVCGGRPQVVSEQHGHWVCGGCYGHENRHRDEND